MFSASHLNGLPNIGRHAALAAALIVAVHSPHLVASPAQSALPTPSPPKAAGPTAPITQPSLYIVGPNDALAVTVYDQPQLSGRYMVQADGTFTFPLLGRVKVGGMAVQAIENELHDRLASGYLKNPQIGVSVDQFRSQQIFVMGEVRQPGELQFTGSMTVIEALARAGSVTEQAGLDVLVVRPSSGAAATMMDVTALQRAQVLKDANVLRVNLENLQRGSAAENMMLQAGDTVFVPRAELIYLSGLVNTSGAHPYRKGMTVRQALALGGGVNERGSTRRIQIVRTVNGQERALNASLQDPVQPGDTIVVRERLF